MKAGQLIPVLRIFDESKAREFYVAFLEFSIDWEHRLEDNFLIYMQISKDDCIIHLSEHHGDACPGSSMLIKTKGVEEYQKILIKKKYKYYRPGIEKTPWDSNDMTVQDPFGNRITFTEQKASMAK